MFLGGEHYVFNWSKWVVLGLCIILLSYFTSLLLLSKFYPISSLSLDILVYLI